MKKINKVVLAYSGGLDTSVILKWLKETYKCEVVTFTADLGQEEDFDTVQKKAEQQNISEIFIEDLKDEFVRDYIFPMFRGNPLYEGYYLLGTSMHHKQSSNHVPFHQISNHHHVLFLQ